MINMSKSYKITLLSANFFDYREERIKLSVAFT